MAHVVYSFKILYPHNVNPYMYTNMSDDTYIKVFHDDDGLKSEYISKEEFASALSIKLFNSNI